MIEYVKGLIGKAKGVYFIFASCFYISWKILRGKKWHMLRADIETESGRTIYTARYTCGAFVLHGSEAQV